MAALRAKEPYQISLLGLGEADADGQAVAKIAFPASAIGRTGVISRLIASIGSIEGIFLLRDEFDRTLAANQDAAIGWANPTLGPGWDSFNDSATYTYQVNGSQGLINYSQSLNARRTVLSAVALADVDYLATVVANSVPATHQFRHAFRAVDGNNFYYAEILYSAANTTSSIALGRVVGGVFTVITAAVPKVVVCPMLVRCTMEGSTLSASMWAVGGAEPSPPDVQGADLTFTAPGGVGLGMETDGLAGLLTLDDVQVSGLGTVPTWDAYLGDPDIPANLRDSSAPNALSRWVPALVNGQPFFPGDELNIVAYGLTEGTQITVTTNVILTPV